MSLNLETFVSKTKPTVVDNLTRTPLMPLKKNLRSYKISQSPTRSLNSLHVNPPPFSITHDPPFLNFHYHTVVLPHTTHTASTADPYCLHCYDSWCSPSTLPMGNLNPWSAPSSWDWSPESPSSLFTTSGSSSPASFNSLHVQSTTYSTLPYGSLPHRHSSPK